MENRFIPPAKFSWFLVALWPLGTKMLRLNLGSTDWLVMPASAGGPAGTSTRADDCHPWSRPGPFPQICSPKLSASFLPSQTLPPHTHHMQPQPPSNSSLQGHQQTPIRQALWPLFDVSAFAALDMVDLSLESHPHPHGILRHSMPLVAPRLPDSSCFFSHLITVARFQGPVFGPLLLMHPFPERPRPWLSPWGRDPPSPYLCLCDECPKKQACCLPVTAPSHISANPAPPPSSRISFCLGLSTPLSPPQIFGFCLDSLPTVMKSPRADSSCLILISFSKWK